MAEDAVPDPREDIDWSKHRGSCRIFYAERRCTCAAVPDPRFRNQLAEVLYQHRRESVRQQLGQEAGPLLLRVLRAESEEFIDALMPTIAAEVEARVQAAANQRAAEERREERSASRAEEADAAASVFGNDDRVVKYLRLRAARAAALASPAPAPRAEEER